MYGFLRQNTASTVLAGPFLNPADGATAKNALTAPTQVASGGTTGFALIKNATRTALAGALTAPAGWAHDALGYYTMNLAAGDVDTVNRLRLEFIDPANYAPVHMDFEVLSTAQYDWLFGTTAPLTDAAAILDLANGIESGETLRQTMRLIRAALAGDATDSGGSLVFKRKDGTTTAVTVTHDILGNRSGVVIGTLT